MRIGRNFQAGNDLWLDAIAAYEGETFAPQLVVGDDVNLSDRVHIACIRSVSIGSGTLIGSGAIITDHAHGVYRGTAQTGPEIPPVKRALHSAGPVTIGRNCWLGDGVAVLAGASIGDGAIIGANSVVTGSIASGTIAAGAPARVLRNWNGQTGEWVQVATETNPSHREGHDGEPL